MGYYKIFIFFLAFFLPSIAEKIPDTTKVKELEKIVVTATRYERKIEDIPASISLLTGKDIEKSPTLNIDEVLKYEPGIFNKRSKELMESMAGVVMRGFAGADQVLVLLDGQPMNNGYVGRVQFNNIAIDDIKNIELVRGPFSSIYGSEAMGGIVNIITATPSSPKLKVRSGFTYGKERNLADNFYFGYEDTIVSKETAFSVSYSQKKDRGYITNDLVKSGKPGSTGINVTGVIPTNDRTGKEVFLYGEGGINSAENRSISSRFFWNINKDQSIKTGLYVAWYKYYNSQGKSFLKDSTGKTIDTGTVKFAFKDTTYTFRVDQRNFLDGDGGQGNLYYNIEYTNKIRDNITFSINGGINHQFENWYTTMGTTSATTRAGGPAKFNTTPNSKANFALQTVWKGWDRNTLISGIAIEGTISETKEYSLKNWLDKESIDSVNYESGGRTATGAFFVNDELALIENSGIIKNLILSAGVRVDYWRTMKGKNVDYVNKISDYYEYRSKLAINPRGGVVLNLDMGYIWQPSVWLSAGKAFRAPTVYDLYRTWLSSTNTLYQSNPDLKPENMYSVELGTRQSFLERRAVLSLTGFYNNVYDMIYNKTISTSPSIIKKMNIGKARIQGIESGLNIKVIKLISLYGTYTFTDAYILEAAESSSLYKKLTNVPQHIAGGGIEIGNQYFYIKYGIRYVSKRYTLDDNSDTISGVYGSRDSFFINEAVLNLNLLKKMSITIGCDNIFDYKYYDYYRAPGRTFSTNIRINF